MISKVTAFTNSLGRLFDNKEAAIKDERRGILRKFLNNQICYGSYTMSCYLNYNNNDYAIESFLTFYNDIMKAFTDLDNKIKEQDQKENTVNA